MSFLIPKFSFMSSACSPNQTSSGGLPTGWNVSLFSLAGIVGGRGCILCKVTDFEFHHWFFYGDVFFWSLKHIFLVFFMFFLYSYLFFICYISQLGHYRSVILIAVIRIRNSCLPVRIFGSIWIQITWEEKFSEYNFYIFKISFK